MVNDLRDLLRESVASPPPDRFDLPTVLTGGRRRVRRRRVAALAGTALATAVVVLAVSFLSLGGRPADPGPAGVPRPDAPTVGLDDAAPATEGTDFRDLFSYTNDNLDRDNGQYLDGVTDDGLVLFRDGPRDGQWWPRLALLDPATGTKDWLPRLDVGQAQTWPLELGADRLVLVTAAGSTEVRLVLHVFDRQRREWSRMTWPDLPDVGDPFSGVVGPDDRLYVRVPATQGEPPPGGWPTDASGEADDADAEGDTYHLWSASMTDPSDVRDEGVTVGSVAFGDHTMVWTDSTNGHAGQVHVRDLDSGEEHAFDPDTGERCNLLGFGATDDRVVMSEYCGTYDGGVRDDRVQVLDTDGHQVVTVQGSGIDGGLATADGPGVVTVTSYERGAAGTYAYDLGSSRFLRLSDDVAKFAAGGPVEGREFLYSTPTNHRHGMTQHVAELVD